ncbi:MAG: hypothetical protein Q9195_008348 [Heterodermia aff. obscurata]
MRSTTPFASPRHLRSSPTLPLRNSSLEKEKPGLDKYTLFPSPPSKQPPPPPPPPPLAQAQKQPPAPAQIHDINSFSPPSTPPAGPLPPLPAQPQPLHISKPRNSLKFDFRFQSPPALELVHPAFRPTASPLPEDKRTTLTSLLLARQELETRSRRLEDILVQQTPPPAYSPRGRTKERGHTSHKRSGTRGGNGRELKSESRSRYADDRGKGKTQNKHTKNLEQIFGARPFSLHPTAATFPFPFSFTSPTPTPTFLDNPLFVDGQGGGEGGKESPSYTLTAQRMRVEAQEVRLRLAETELEIELVRLRRLVR